MGGPLSRARSATDKWTAASLASAVLSAFVASLCCLGPLVFAALGLGGAGLLVKFEAFRPLLTVVTLALLGTGFYFTYRKPKVPAASAEAGEDCGCEQPRRNRLGKAALWITTFLVLAFLASPYLVGVLLG